MQTASVHQCSISPSVFKFNFIPCFGNLFNTL